MTNRRMAMTAKVVRKRPTADPIRIKSAKRNSLRIWSMEIRNRERAVNFTY
jgi:hypothetical protein